jgi:hypothetical protein
MCEPLDVWNRKTLGPPETHDFESPTANMYGYEPCPRCQSRYRCSFDGGPDAGLIVCDDCGYRAPYVMEDE